MLYLSEVLPPRQPELPARAPNRIPHAARAIEPLEGLAASDARVAERSPRRPRQLLRRRGAHAVRPFLEAAEDGALRHRAARPSLPHELRTGVPPADDTPRGRRRGRAVPLVRVDIAGNISKRFSGSGIRFARFSGACPRWNVFAALHHAGHDPDPVLGDARRHGRTSARGAHDPQGSGGYARRPAPAIAIGCEVSRARKLVYAEASTSKPEPPCPSGITCRLCERVDCEQRAFPPMQHQLGSNEDVRGKSFYTPV